MNDVLTIADAILKIAKEEGRSLTPMQLVKLTYIAQGWSLARLDRLLFAERIEAWKYGPVIPDLYRATRRWGRNPIDLNLVTGDIPVDTETESLLRDVMEYYGHYDGIALSYLTHKTGTPWDRVFREGENVEIPPVEIQRHYETLLNDRRQAAVA